MIDPVKKISFIAHDAGCAEILSNFIMLENYECRYSLAGPAIDVFEKNL